MTSLIAPTAIASHGRCSAQGLGPTRAGTSNRGLTHYWIRLSALVAQLRIPLKSQWNEVMKRTPDTEGLVAYARREMMRATLTPGVDLLRVQNLREFLRACAVLEPEAPIGAVQYRASELLKNSLKARARVARTRREELIDEVGAYRARSALRQSQGMSNDPAHIPTFDFRAASSSAMYDSL